MPAKRQPDGVTAVRARITDVARATSAILAFYGAPLSLVVARPAAASPNVVVILADDMGWGDLSFHGNSNLQTPHIDSLGRMGASFENFFVQPVCAPTRAEFLTGRYHPRGGVRGVSTGGERLDLDEATIADAFRAAGYATGVFGKWHNGSQYPYHPNGRGFDEFYGFLSGHWGDYFDAPLDHNGRAVRGDGYLPDDVTAHAISFIHHHQREGRPFFCYLAFNTPHSPMQVPDNYWDEFAAASLALRGSNPKAEETSHTRAALAMCKNLDDNVGRLLKAVDDLRATEETIVVFFSDNGPNGPRWNGGMKGMKGTTDEGGVRSPLFIRWSGTIRPAATVRALAGSIDLLPTICTLAGVPSIVRKPLDGVDLAPWALDSAAQPPDRMLFQSWAGATSARSQRYRLDARGRLFDMKSDRGQTHDLASSRPVVAARLAKGIKQWRGEVLAELPEADDRPFLVGFKPHSATVLPAQDGRPHGGVQRSGKAPNSSYFTHWTTPADTMTWEVEFAAGRHLAQLAYCCPPEDVGAAIELTMGNARWSGTIDVAHDPPLRGQEHDRAPRHGESYVKDFRLLSLGEVDVAAGSATLTLRAIKIVGKQAADVESIILVRQP